MPECSQVIADLASKARNRASLMVENIFTNKNATTVMFTEINKVSFIIYYYYYYYYYYYNVYSYFIATIWLLIWR